jgi:putative restriction endonuclease
VHGTSLTPRRRVRRGHPVRGRARQRFPLSGPPPAYNSQCAICRLKELRLLDAAHILSDVLEAGEPTIQNGLSLCAIHHRAFDQNLIGVSPDYIVHVSRRLLEDEDGPMLDLLKGFHERSLSVPSRSADRPDRERLDIRFASFLQLAV